MCTNAHVSYSHLYICICYCLLEQRNEAVSSSYNISLSACFTYLIWLKRILLGDTLPDGLVACRLFDGDCNIHTKSFPWLIHEVPEHSQSYLEIRWRNQGGKNEAYAMGVYSFDWLLNSLMHLFMSLYLCVPLLDSSW